MAAGDAPLPEAGDSADAPGPFVINLCSSTTPMALAHPDSPELKRFSFFVSRRREDNRERFRLHMGYFSTLAEAEEWLNVIRDVYPGAWAGEAPGRKLRARAAAAALAAQLPSPPAPTRPAPPPSNAARVAAPAAAKPAAAARPAAAATAPSAAVPTLRPATPAAPPVSKAAAPARAPAPQPSRPAASPVQTPPLAGRRAVPAPPPASAIRSAANPPRRPVAPAAPPPPAKPLARKQGAQTALSNIREVIGSLDDETGQTRQMRLPPGLRPSAPESAAPPARAPAAPLAARHVEAPPPASSLSDTQVLKILENRRADEGDRSNEEASSGISLLKPDDTGTRRALKEAVQENAPVSFAVQLYWSVQPVELDKVPPLAIFSAYTLYTVEGSREGRKWYGLRLGFFSDAISAKQVAYYVRSEFTSVAVVPVSPAEKGRASDEENRATSGALMKKRVQEQKVEEFKLFEDEKPASPSPAAAKPAAAAPAAPAPKSGPVKKNKPLGKVRAKEARPQKTLEETLEILGASELSMDTDRGASLNDTGVRHLRVQVTKNTPFAKLLDRLSERVRRG